MSIPQPPYKTFAETKVLEILPVQSLPSKIPVKSKPIKIDGFRYINIYVQADGLGSSSDFVDLRVEFGLDDRGLGKANCYVNLEANLSSQQKINPINVSGNGMWLGRGGGCYIVRLPVMGPYVEVSVTNQTNNPEIKGRVWAYLVS